MSDKSNTRPMGNLTETVDRLAGPDRGEVSIDFIVTGDSVQTVVRCDQPLKPGRYTARASLKVRP